MNRKLTSCLIFSALTVLLAGCHSKEISPKEAGNIAKRELQMIASKDGIKAVDLKAVSTVENKEIDGWEYYFENADKSYRLNVLVTRDGRAEAHRLVKAKRE